MNGPEHFQYLVLVLVDVESEKRRMKNQHAIM